MANISDAVGAKFSLDTKEAIKNVDNLNKEVNSLGKNISKAFQTSAIIAWGSAIKSVTEQMINASKAQSGYVESMNLLEVSYKSSTEEGKKLLENTEQLMDTLKNFYGLDTAGLAKQAGIYKQMASAMGISNEVSAQMTEGLLKMQEDVSSLYNLDVEEVGRKFQSALAGQTRAVRSLGVDITQATLQQELYNLGIDKSVSELNRASKTALIYMSMQRQLTNANGDAARTINSVANQSRIFREQLTIAARQIGAIFIPVLKTILPYLNGILMALNAIGEFILGLLGQSPKDLASEFGIKSIDTGIEGIGNTAAKASKQVDDLRGKLRGFDKLNVITTPKESSSGGIGGIGGGGVSKDLLNAMKDYNSELEKAKNKAKEIRDCILKWLGFTIDENGQITGFKLTLGTIVGMLVVGGVLYKGVKAIFSIFKGIGGLLSATGLVGKGLSGMSNSLKGVGKVNGTANSFTVPKISTVLKGLADLALIIGGLIALSQVIGLISQTPGFKENMTAGLETLKDMFGNLLKIIVPLTLFSAGITVLGSINVSTVLKGVLNFTLIIGGLEAIVLAIGAINQIQGIQEVTDTGLANIEKLFNTIQSVFVPMGLFTAGIAVLGVLNVATVLSGMISFALIVAGTEAIILAVGGILHIPGFQEASDRGLDAIIKLFNSLEKVFVPMGMFTAGIVALGLATPVTVLSGMAGFAAVILGLEAIIAAVGVINQIPGFQWLIEEGSVALIKLAETLGGFAGALIKGFLDKATESFGDIGTHLSEFMINAQPFFEGLSNVSGEGVEATKRLAETVLILTANNILEGLTKWITGGNSLEQFGEQLAKFAPNFKKYYDEIRDVQPDVIEASANAAKSLAEMANNLPNQGGVVSWFAGDNPIDEFGKHLPDFGKQMMDYYNNIKDMKPNVVKESADAAKSLAEFAKSLPDHGGIIKDWFTGNTDTIEDFGKHLPDFGRYLKQYSDNVDGLKPAVVKESADAAKSLAEFAKSLPSHGGMTSWFIGETETIDKFGEKLPKFGKDLKQYSDNVSGIKADVVTNSTNAAKSIAEFSNNLPKHGGIVSWFTGDNDIASFGERLRKFGEQFKKYYENISNIAIDKVNSVSDAVQKIANVAISIKNNGAENTMKDFGNSLSNASTGFNRFFSNSNAESIGTQFGTAIGNAIAKGIKKTNFPTIQLKSDDNTTTSRFRLSAYKEGGFVDSGELFLAREAGPELVGRIGSKTAVANDDQIVNSIAKGLAMSGIGNDANVTIVADSDTEGLLNFINFKQQQKNRQYGL